MTPFQEGTKKHAYVSIFLREACKFEESRCLKGIKNVFINLSLCHRDTSLKCRACEAEMTYRTWGSATHCKLLCAPASSLGGRGLWSIGWRCSGFLQHLISVCALHPLLSCRVYAKQMAGVLGSGSPLCPWPSYHALLLVDFFLPLAIFGVRYKDK